MCSYVQGAAANGNLRPKLPLDPQLDPIERVNEFCGGQEVSGKFIVSGRPEVRSSITDSYRRHMTDWGAERKFRTVADSF